MLIQGPRHARRRGYIPPYLIPGVAAVTAALMLALAVSLLPL